MKDKEDIRNKVFKTANGQSYRYVTKKEFDRLLPIVLEKEKAVLEYLIDK